MLIQPTLKDEAFLASIRDIATGGRYAFLWWLGQSGFLIAWKHSRLLLDPYLSDSLTTKYAGTNTPHVRMTGRVVDPKKLVGITAIAVSHHHWDHADPETLTALLDANPDVQIFAPSATLALIAQRCGLPRDRLTGLDSGVSAAANDFLLTGIASAHESFEQDASGRYPYLGYRILAGKLRIYHSGDTVIYDRLADRLRELGVDIALLPINGRGKGVPGNMTAQEAASFAKQIGAACAIPCHYDMFSFNTGSVEQFLTACERLQVDSRRPRCGERLRMSLMEQRFLSADSVDN